MKVLFYSTCILYTKIAYGVLSDEAQKMANDGHEVYFLTCGKRCGKHIMNCCSGNPQANKGLCITCEFWTSKALSVLDKRIKRISFADYIKDKQEKTEWNYNSSKELRSTTYRDANIGLAAMSFYIDNTRNLHPKITPESKPYFDNLLDQGRTLTNASINLLSELKPDKVVLFNGRLLETRVLFDTCKNLNVPIDVMEVHPSNNPNQSFKVVFENNLPHNIKYRHKVITEMWDNSPLCEEEKKAIANSFFLNRRKSKPAGDKVYTANQEFGLLPKDWNNSKHNIAIFNSSEDEFAAVGGDFDKLALFDSQIEGIKFILDKFKENKDYHFYLRVHPNLSKIKYKYHTDLYKLSDLYTNITVIPATDRIDTYALMDAAEKVIVFGSTMGVEAAYWNKPVILLGASLYYYGDICHTPKKKEETIPMIESALEPKSDIFIQKFGYYIMDFKRATFEEQMYRYFDYTTYSISIGGLKAHGVNYHTLLGSKKLFLFTISAIRLILEKTFKNKFRLPTEEE